MPVFRSQEPLENLRPFAGYRHNQASRFSLVIACKNFEMLAEQPIAMEAAVAHLSLRERLDEPGFDRANIFLVGEGAVHDVDQCRIF